MKRLGIVFLFLFGSLAYGQSYCGQRIDQVNNALGQAVPNISVTYYSQPSGSLATVYSSTTCSTTSQNGVSCSSGICSNPQITSGLGQAFAYLAPGLYTVTYSGAQIQTQTLVDQNIPTQGGASGGLVSGQTAATLPIASGPNALTGPSHLSESGGVDIFSQPTQSPGFYDLTRGIAQFFSSGVPYNGATDPCSRSVSNMAADDTNGFTGGIYADNTPPSGTGPLEVNCGPAGFFDPAALTLPVPHSSTNAAQYQLKPWANYNVQSGQVIPPYSTLEGGSPFQSTSLSGSWILPNQTSFTTNPYVTGFDSAMVSLGAPVGTAGANFTLGSVGRNFGVSCGGIPDVVGLYNSLGQQASRFEGNSITGCYWPVYVATTGTAGGSQNNWGFKRTIVSMINAPTFPVMTGISLSNAGSGYTHDFPLIVSGCTVAPSLMAQTSGGSLTGEVYARNSGATTITAFSVASDVVTVYATNSYLVGDIVSFSGLGVATFLNSQTLSVTSATSSSFTVSFTTANVNKTSDSGTVAIPNLAATLNANAFGDCPTPTGVSISFANGAGTGAAGIPIIQTLTTNSAFTIKGANTTIDMGSAVSGATTIPIPSAYALNANDEEVDNSYAESTRIGVDIGNLTAANLSAIGVHNFHFSGANQYGYSVVRTSGVPAEYDFDNILGSQTFLLLADPNKNGGNVPLRALISGGGNSGAIGHVSRDAEGWYLSNTPDILTNVPIGQSAPNCGTGCTTNEAPAAGYPCKRVGGDFQRMISGDTAEPAGICENGSFSTTYAVSTGGSACASGHCPGIFDNTPVSGDYIALGAETPAELHDTGSSNPPSSGYTFGTVGDPLNGDLLTAPSTPNVSGVTTTVTGASTITDTYCFAAVPTTRSFTTSACSATVTVSNAPQSLSGSNSITFNNLPTTNNLAVYRLSIGHSNTLTITDVCGPDGTAAYAYASAGSSSGYTSGLEPTIAFTGGGFSTEPTGTAQFVGGSFTGVNFAQRGLNCTGNGTGTLTTNGQEVGLIDYTKGSSSYTDHGQPAMKGTSAPGSAVNGPNIDVKVQQWYGSSLNNPCTTQGCLIVGGTGGTPNALNIGTGGTVLTSNGTTPSWGAPSGFMNGLISSWRIGGASSFSFSGDSVSNSTGATGSTQAATATSLAVVQSTSAVTSGDSAGWFGLSVIPTSFLPVQTFGIRYSSSTDYTTNNRIQLGMLQESGSGSCSQATFIASDTPACTYAAITYSTVRGDTAYQCQADTGTGTPTISSIGVAPVAATLTKMNVQVNATSVVCTVNGTSTTITITLPSAIMVSLFLNTVPGGGATHLDLSGQDTFSANGSYN